MSARSLAGTALVCALPVAGIVGSFALVAQTPAHASVVTSTPVARMMSDCQHARPFTIGGHRYVCAEQQPADNCEQQFGNPVCFALFGFNSEAMLNLFGDTASVGGRD